MRQFKWIEWNLRKIDAHGLSAEEVEASFDRVFSFQERKDRSFRMFAATPSRRRRDAGSGWSGGMIGTTMKSPMSSASLAMCPFS